MSKAGPASAKPADVPASQVHIARFVTGTAPARDLELAVFHVWYEHYEKEPNWKTSLMLGDWLDEALVLFTEHTNYRMAPECLPDIQVAAQGWISERDIVLKTTFGWPEPTGVWTEALGEGKSGVRNEWICHYCKRFLNRIITTPVVSKRKIDAIDASRSAEDGRRVRVHAEDASPAGSGERGAFAPRQATFATSPTAHRTSATNRSTTASGENFLLSGILESGWRARAPEYGASTLHSTNQHFSESASVHHMTAGLSQLASPCGSTCNHQHTTPSTAPPMTCFVTPSPTAEPSVVGPAESELGSLRELLVQHITESARTLRALRERNEEMRCEQRNWQVRAHNDVMATLVGISQQISAQGNRAAAPVLVQLPPGVCYGQYQPGPAN